MITMKHFEQAMRESRRSVNDAKLAEYDNFNREQNMQKNKLSATTGQSLAGFTFPGQEGGGAAAAAAAAPAGDDVSAQLHAASVRPPSARASPTPPPPRRTCTTERAAPLSARACVVVG